METTFAKALKVIGWIELVVATPLLYLLIRVAQKLFWEAGQNQTHGEWLPLVAPIVALLFASFALPGAAAIRSWPRPWWWQLVAVAGLIIGILFTIM